MPAETSFSIEPRGPFTLASAARFIAGWPPTSRGDRELGDEVVRLGFLVDDFLEGISAPPGQHIDALAGLGIDQDRGVPVPLAQREVINLPRRRGNWTTSSWG